MEKDETKNEEVKKESPDLFTVLTVDKTTKEAVDPVEVLHGSLMSLFDKMLNDAGITDPVKLQKLASLRAMIDIRLKDF